MRGAVENWSRCWTDVQLSTTTNASTCNNVGHTSRGAALARANQKREKESRNQKRQETGTRGRREWRPNSRHKANREEAPIIRPTEGTVDRGSASGVHKDDKPRERGSTSKGPRPSKAKGAPTKEGKTGQIAKKPRGNNKAGMLAKAAKLTNKLATYFAPPKEPPPPTETQQPYPVYEQQRAPPMGVPERDRWERSEELRERREEDRERERQEQEAKRERDKHTRERTDEQVQRWAQIGEEPTERRPMTMVTWNCCNLQTATNTITRQSDLEKVIEGTEAQVVMIQETRVRQAHKRTQPSKSSS